MSSILYAAGCQGNSTDDDYNSDLQSSDHFGTADGGGALGSEHLLTVVRSCATSLPVREHGYFPNERPLFSF